MWLISIVIVVMLLVLTISAQTEEGTTVYGFTYQNTTGNRYVEGSGTFPDVAGLSWGVSISQGMWIVPLKTEQGTFIRGISDENALAFLMPVLINPNYLDFGFAFAFPMDMLLTGITALWQPSFTAQDISPLSHPVPVGADVVYIANNGDLMLWRDDVELFRLPINAMLDARPMVSATGLIAVYTQPTIRYPHGVFGDEIEAGALEILQIDGDILRRVGLVQLENIVFEGLYPFWADVDQDGEQDIVTTISGGGLGAGLRVYRTDGSLLAESDRIDLSNRWRHQIAYAPFGPQGEYELVEIQTPHIGGIVQFLRYVPQTDRLEVVARAGGYTSHVYGSRNIEMAVAGDFDGDGQPEVVVTTQDGTRLVGLRHGVGDRVEEVWSIDLPAVPVTNFVAFHLPEERLGLTIGLADGNLYVWRSRG